MKNNQTNSTPAIRFGVLGCGMIADYHAAAIAVVGGTLAGASSRSKESAEHFCSLHNAAWIQSFESMLKSPDIDVIVVCTPSGQHAAQAIAAMRAGKHVVVEKPMCITLAEADEIIRVSQETCRLVSVISQMRFSDGVRAAKTAVESGMLGKISCASLSMQYFRSDAYYAQAAWRGTWALDGGGCLMNQGIHGIDAFRYILGPVESLSGYIATRTHEIEVEDAACAALKLRCGAPATIDASTASNPGYPRRIMVCGSRGSIMLEDTNVIRWDIPDPCPVALGGGTQNAAAADPRSLKKLVHVPQYKNIVAAVNGEEPLVLGAREGREALEIILGIYRSAATGERVKIAGQ